MKKSLLLFLSIILFCTIATMQPSSAQGMRQLSLGEVKVEMRGNAVNGITGTHPFAEGKSSGPYQLYQTDSLSITVTYKLLSNSSRRSSVKDSALRLKIEYSVEYKGMTTTKKAEKMYFLDDSQRFSEKEIFNFQSGRFSNTVVRLSYSGRILE